MKIGTEVPIINQLVYKDDQSPRSLYAKAAVRAATLEPPKRKPFAAFTATVPSVDVFAFTLVLILRPGHPNPNGFFIAER